MKNFKFLVFLSFLNFASAAFSAQAADESAVNQLYFYYGQNAISPSEVNDQISSEGLDKFTKMSQYGLQASKYFLRYLDLGFRLGVKNGRVDGTGGNFASLSQPNFLLMVDIPLVKADNVKFNLFTAFGVASTTFEVKTASETGTLKKGSSNLYLGGASVAFGKKYFFFKIEGGYEYNSVGNLAMEGSVNSSITKVNMSGGYVNVGLLIDDIKMGRF